MINVTVGSNLNRKTITGVDESTTVIRDVLDQNGIDYKRFTVHLNGDVVTPEKLDQTFAAAGIYEDCFLVTTTKADSAL